MSASQRDLLRWVELQVRACRPIALRYFRSASLRVERKPDESPVTIADRLIEERLRAVIERAYPGEGILGEEFGRSRPRATTYWTIDPIDGTRAFSRGLPTWGVMIARVEGKRPTLGLIDFPAVGTTIGVAPGVRAYERRNGRVSRLARPRPIRAMRDAVILHGGARWWLPTPYARGLARVMRGCYLERAYGDCYGYLLAFRGCADAVIDYGVKPWDLAPLSALAQATWRVLTDFSGRASFTSPDTLMASPSLARRIVRLLQR